MRPLVVRFGAFGDMILLLPALNLLARRYGDACEVVGSGGWTEPLLRRVPDADRPGARVAAIPPERVLAAWRRLFPGAGAPPN